MSSVCQRKFPTRPGNDIRASRKVTNPEFIGVKYFNKLLYDIRGLPLKSFINVLKNCFIQNIFYLESEFLVCDINNINFDV